MFSPLLLSAVLCLPCVPLVPKDSDFDYGATFAIYQGNPQAKSGKPRMLANPSLKVSVNRQASFSVGGEVQAKAPSGLVTIPYGVFVKVTVTHGINDHAYVHLIFDKHDIVDQAGGDVQITTKGTQLLKSVKIGEKYTLHLGDKTGDQHTWIEFTIQSDNGGLGRTFSF